MCQWLTNYIALCLPQLEELEMFWINVLRWWRAKGNLVWTRWRFMLGSLLMWCWRIFLFSVMPHFPWRIRATIWEYSLFCLALSCPGDYCGLRCIFPVLVGMAAVPIPVSSRPSRSYLCFSDWSVGPFVTCFVWGCFWKTVQKLQVTKFLIGMMFYDHAMLHWLSICFLAQLKMLMIAFNKLLIWRVSERLLSLTWICPSCKVF